MKGRSEAFRVHGAFSVGYGGGVKVTAFGVVLLHSNLGEFTLSSVVNLAQPLHLALRVKAINSFHDPREVAPEGSILIAHPYSFISSAPSLLYQAYNELK